MSNLTPSDLEALMKKLEQTKNPSKKDYELLQKMLLEQALSLKNLVENNQKLEAEKANTNLLNHVNKALNPKEDLKKELNKDFKPDPVVPSLLKKYLLLQQQLKLTPEEDNRKKKKHDPFKLTPPKPGEL